MVTPEFMRRMRAKHRAEREVEHQPEGDDPGHEGPPAGVLSARPRIRTTPAPDAVASRARRAADTRILNRHGRSRQEIDAILLREYRTKGPTLLARELGMKVTTVMMRARRRGLSADPHLASLRRSESRRKGR